MLVLGIDTAWTISKPSGLALVKWHDEKRNELVCFARSYDEFINTDLTGEINWIARLTGSFPDMDRIIGQAAKIAGEPVQVVALDMPLSPQQINGRRAADDAISRAYGEKGASTHTPSVERPGEISKRIFRNLQELGFTWASINFALREVNNPVFIETYPHPAIIHLLKLDYRLPYKVSKINKYWGDKSPAERRLNWAGEIEKLRQGLLGKIENLSEMIPPVLSLFDYTNRVLQDYENVLDALVCAWAGCEFLSGRIRAYGDENSAIWIPTVQKQVFLKKGGLQWPIR